MDKALVIIESNSGNTKTFLEFLQKHSRIPLEIVEDFSKTPENYEKIAFGAYTWKNGKIPSDMKKYLIENRNYLKGKEIFIFGSGLSIYPKFCGAVDGMEKICSDCEANIHGTFKFEQRFNENEYYTTELINILNNWSQ